MTLVDLTHPIRPAMPVFPGDPAVSSRTALELEVDGVAVSEWTLGSHTGTHVDAPSHRVRGGRTTSDLAAGELCGWARVLAFRADAASLGFESVLGGLPETFPRIVLLASGFDTHFGTTTYEDWPPVEPGFARHLWEAGMRVLGVDTFSPDPPGHDEPVHDAVLGRDGLIVENLRGLSDLPSEVEVVILPLLLADADGAPVRALAGTFPSSESGGGIVSHGDAPLRSVRSPG